jgi:hypothetical protein
VVSRSIYQSMPSPPPQSASDARKLSDTAPLMAVNRGTTVYFLIDPKADFGFDLIEIDLTIYRPPVPPSLPPQS